MRLLSRHPAAVPVNEPGFGEHLADVRTRSSGGPGIEFLRYNDLRAETPDYFFAKAYAARWRPLVRQLLLHRLHAHVEDLAEEAGIATPRVVVKEPNGSQAADLIMSFGARLPGSRRTRRRRLGAGSELFGLEGGRFGGEISASQRQGFIRHRASLWVHQMEIVQRAYLEHSPDRRIIVRYEELLSNTQRTLKRIMDPLLALLEPGPERMGSGSGATEFSDLGSGRAGSYGSSFASRSASRSAYGSVSVAPPTASSLR